MAVTAPAPPDPKRANVLYHDAAAAAYDDKWSVSFEGPAVSYVRERARRMLPAERYERALELGTGTGFFVLNLWQAGYVGELHATDISEGMLAVCRRNARRLGCRVRTRVADAEKLPYADGEFDLVVGHAFLHHLPKPRTALREAFRVLRPGGALLIAGEPTRLGDRLAGVAKRLTYRTFRAAAAVPALRRLCRDRPTPASARDRVLRDLEFVVDLHTFRPAEVAGWARAEGFETVRAETEELLASLFGWAVRTMESEVREGLLGPRWGRLAFLGWRGLYEVDRLLYRVLPHPLFYNLLLYAEKPGRP